MHTYKKLFKKITTALLHESQTMLISLAKEEIAAAILRYLPLIPCV